jgi:hypothetical protein
MRASVYELRALRTIFRLCGQWRPQVKLTPCFGAPPAAVMQLSTHTLSLVSQGLSITFTMRSQCRWSADRFTSAAAAALASSSRPCLTPSFTFSTHARGVFGACRLQPELVPADVGKFNACAANPPRRDTQPKQPKLGFRRAVGQRVAHPKHPQKQRH